jgi:uncharacterized membrane protein YedE/YeeE
MRTRAAAAGVGAVFGATLSWSGLTGPEVIRDGLLFHKSYLFLVFAAAVTTAFVGLQILRRLRPRALLTGEPIAWTTVKPQRNHVVGSLIFGVGWATADACPGPVATQLGQGIAWGVPTAVGIIVGVWYFLRRQEPAAVRTKGRYATPRPITT